MPKPWDYRYNYAVRNWSNNSPFIKIKVQKGSIILTCPVTFRQDQSAKKTGVMVLIRSDIVHRRVEELQNTHPANGNRMEALVLEVIFLK